MTVSELIEELRKYDGALPVCYPDRDYGAQAVCTLALADGTYAADTRGGASFDDSKGPYLELS